MRRRQDRYSWPTVDTSSTQVGDSSSERYLKLPGDERSSRLNTFPKLLASEMPTRRPIVAAGKSV